MPPPKSSTDLLKQLRSLMKNLQYVREPLNAYIVPSNDAHNSEYLADADKRRAFISGFTGSFGTAIITQQEACLWTDGRYYLQAGQEMDSNWILMKEGISTTPSQGTWLAKNLPPNSYVGVDPKLMTHDTWMPLNLQLQGAGHKLIPISNNLIDLLWTGKPPAPKNPVMPLAFKYTGKTIAEKFDAVQDQMKEKNAGVLVLTALDEIAWFLNMRGSDIAYNPVFFAHLMILRNSFNIFIDSSKMTSEVNEHLKSESGKIAFRIEPYDKINEVLKDLVTNSKEYVWLPNTTSYALTSLVPAKLLVTEISPVRVMKAIKNAIEIKGMINAHIKDAAALCCYFAWLEKEVPGGKVTEISGADKLNDFRKLQEDYVGPSFTTISSVGPHGAIIHYQPKESTDVPITTNELYLCDSGGQFKDGTTDVTRTLHFGTPTNFEKECYTRVLKGQLKLGATTFPSQLKGSYLDSFAREFLWDIGLDYLHGTGHGIGAYLNVHEGPMGISWKNIPDDPGLTAGMFLSNEPGYYEDGKFGIRIEDIMYTVNANLPHNFNNRGFLTFSTVTLVPKQIKMIKVDMLTKKEIIQLNEYHNKCREVIGPVLEQQNQSEGKAWLWRETKPIEM